MTSETNNHFDVFLSHAHVDAEIVERLGKRLEDEGSCRVWLDRWILVPGEHWQQAIAKAIKGVNSCAVCIGQRTPNGWFQEEIERALNLQSKNKSFRVIPVILPGSSADMVEGFLELRTWIDFSKGLEDKLEFHRLISGVQGVSPGRTDSKLSSADTRMQFVKRKLNQIRELRVETLIDESLALEYQRRLLEQLLDE
jgi:hypothetical protein